MDNWAFFVAYGGYKDHHEVSLTWVEGFRVKLLVFWRSHDDGIGYPKQTS